jgi:hypothetical protein
VHARRLLAILLLVVTSLSGWQRIVEVLPRVKAPREVRVPAFSAIPRTVEEFQAVYDRKPTRPELEDLREADKLLEETELTNAGLRAGMLLGVEMLQRYLDLPHISDVAVVMGHNVAGNFRFLDGTHAPISELENMIIKRKLRPVFLSCHSQEYLRTPGAGVERTITASEAIGGYERIHEERGHGRSEEGSSPETPHTAVPDSGVNGRSKRHQSKNVNAGTFPPKEPSPEPLTFSIAVDACDRLNKFFTYFRMLGINEWRGELSDDEFSFIVENILDPTQLQVERHCVGGRLSLNVVGVVLASKRTNLGANGRAKKSPLTAETAAQRAKWERWRRVMDNDDACKMARNKIALERFISRSRRMIDLDPWFKSCMMHVFGYGEPDAKEGCSNEHVHADK